MIDENENNIREKTLWCPQGELNIGSTRFLDGELGRPYLFRPDFHHQGNLGVEDHLSALIVQVISTSYHAAIRPGFEGRAYRQTALSEISSPGRTGACICMLFQPSPLRAATSSST